MKIVKDTSGTGPPGLIQLALAFCAEAETLPVFQAWAKTKDSHAGDMSPASLTMQLEVMFYVVRSCDPFMRDILLSAIGQSGE